MTDPEIVAAIEAQYALDVYEARVRMRQRLAGVIPPPPTRPQLPSRLASAVRDVDRRCGGRVR